MRDGLELRGDSRFGSPLQLSKVHWVRPEIVVEVDNPTKSTVIHIRTWNEPVRFTFAWGSTLAVGTCERVK
jgi:hypothetical protein